MPGIAGIYLEDDPVQNVLEDMLAELNHSKQCCMQLGCDSSNNYAYGSALHKFVRSCQSLPENEISKDVFLFDGECYPIKNNDHLISEMARCLNKEDLRGLKQIPGIFCAAGFDPSQKKIRLVNDKFGLKNIFYTKSAKGFAFASEIKALLKIPGISTKYDGQAFSDFYRFGFTLGSKTLFNDIHLLPPGSVLAYDISTHEITIDNYFRLDSLFCENGTWDSRLDLNTVADSFVKGVRERMGDDTQKGISLSGGLDSRAILAAMQEKAGGIASYTLGLKGCHDEKLSDQMAKISGTVHTMLELGVAYLGDFKTMAETLIYFSDGLYHPHESTEKLALDYFKDAGLAYVFRGHGGEIAKASLAYPIQVDASIRSVNGMEGVLKYIGDRANLVARELDISNIFKKSFHDEIKEGWKKSLEDTASGIEKDLAPEDVCIYFYIQEWIRRQVVSSLAIFRSQVEIRLPYLDEFFLEQLLKLPIEQRYAGEVQKKVVEMCMPQLTKIPDSNTGAPLDAGRLRLFVTDKFNSVMRRLSLPGFRHYTEYEKWQRKEFKESIEKIIFDEQTLDRDIYDPDGLKTAFNNHVSGKKNHAHLLGTVSGLELWFRMFVD
jgi:asparagine synthase (glutamine-hydrolysing)